MEYHKSNESLWDDEDDEEEVSLGVQVLTFGCVFVLVAVDWLLVQPICWVHGLWSRKTVSSAPIADKPRRGSQRATTFFGAD